MDTKDIKQEKLGELMERINRLKHDTEQCANVSQAVYLLLEDNAINKSTFPLFKHVDFMILDNLIESVSVISDCLRMELKHIRDTQRKIEGFK